jgi:hypothetical protein
MYLNEELNKQYQLLCEQHSEWSESTFKFITAYGESTPHDLDFASTKNYTNVEAKTEAERTMRKAEHALEENLRAWLEGMDLFLEPLLGKNSQLTAFMNSSLTSIGVAGSVLPSLLLLLGDETMHALPWEGLEFCKKFQGRISRDYSLAVLGNRLKNVHGVSGVDKIVVHSSTLSMVIDPMGDDMQKSTDKDDTADAANTKKQTLSSHNDIRTVVHNIKSNPKIKGSQHWSNVIHSHRESEGMPLQNWISQSSSSLLSSNPEKSLFVYIPGKVVGGILNYNELSSISFQNVPMIYVTNMSHTYLSYRRQISVDSRKLKDEVMKESPVYMNALFSLSGANNIASYQWCTTATSQEKISTTFWEKFACGENVSFISAIGQSREFFTSKDTDRNGSNSPREQCVFKRWVKYAQVVYGCANTVYVDGIPERTASAKKK